MKEPQVITVAMAEKDQYGNLKVTDNLGNEYKIGAKRDHLFELFVQGRAVKITWDNYKNKDYVSDAELFDGKPPEEKRIETVTAGVEKVPPKPQISGEERGMWWKELGEWLRLKEEDKGANPVWKQLRLVYFAKLFSVCDIEIKDKED